MIVFIKIGGKGKYANEDVGVPVYLCSADPDDPGRRDDDGSMSSQRAALLNLLQHEACHLVVILKHTQKILNVKNNAETLYTHIDVLQTHISC